MKKILIVSATKKTNYDLAKKLKKLIKSNIEITLISLEDYILPIYTEDEFENKKETYKKTVISLTNYFVQSDGIIICGPEYNGSTPPIINNSIAWISSSTKYWRDAFNNKIALIGTSSGGQGTKFITALKLQLEHLGCTVLPRTITTNSSNPLNTESAQKILNRFIKLL